LLTELKVVCYKLLLTCLLHVVSQNLTFPSHVGFPLGTDDAAKYVVMETHYDNPSRRSGNGQI